MGGLWRFELASGTLDDLERRLHPVSVPQMWPLLRAPRLVQVLQLCRVRHRRALAVCVQAFVPRDAIHERVLPLESRRAMIASHLGVIYGQQLQIAECCREKK